jgi:endoglucanase
MNYRFYVNDFDRIKNFRSDYPEAGRIFEYPMSFWLGTRKPKRLDPVKVHHSVSRLMSRARPAMPIFVLYNMPLRDLGHHSRGGALTENNYLEFVEAVACAIGCYSPMVIFEPDALPHALGMAHTDSDARFGIMRQALDILTAKSDALVYTDIGHSNWLDAEVAGMLLNKVHVPGVRGFSVNVSNFRSTAESMRWAMQVAEYTPSKNFVIDTSRNGLGPYGNDWCNPPGRSLGNPPTVDTGNHLCDAFLWVKVPGESDGKCNGGPRAGRFWPQYADELVSNTSWIS